MDEPVIPVADLTESETRPGIYYDVERNCLVELQSNGWWNWHDQLSFVPEPGVAYPLGARIPRY